MTQGDAKEKGQPTKSHAASTTRPVFAPRGVDFSTAPLSIRPIVDLKQNIWDRQKRVRALGKYLKPDELQALCGFLMEKHDEYSDQRGHVLKSDLMDALCAQTTPPSDLSQVLAKVYHDKDQNEVIRDYVVQHFSILYERLAEELANRTVSQKTELQGLLWEAVTETDSSIAGTALLGLNRLTRSQPEFDRNRIGETALKLADDPNASELVRATALQVCAQLQVQAAVSLLMRAAKQQTDTPLRISAIGGLGLVGGKPELEFLQRIANENNPRLQPALTLAMQRVGQRLGQP